MDLAQGKIKNHSKNLPCLRDDPRQSAAIPKRKLVIGQIFISASQARAAWMIPPLGPKSAEKNRKPTVDAPLSP